ncbi:hypothetical protein F444_20037 [Phytophthora nicotianae P1976]|uniref:Uncharacterized protein n=1 Tax=Phytophthora nicotianae P1976 TaxID=1317066 RepID=A0A080Z5W1_PHYNI|nr:hypothetical protein F444_20037 [Phytophthora nicotianae P1976]
MVIKPTNQFEIVLFLHVVYPHIFSNESDKRPIFGVVVEPNDEHVKAWMQTQYSEASILTDRVDVGHTVVEEKPTYHLSKSGNRETIAELRNGGTLFTTSSMRL